MCLLGGLCLAVVSVVKTEYSFYGVFFGLIFRHLSCKCHVGWSGI
jgi:hypothetical protein